MKDIDSFYGILGDKKTAIIEMAATSGLPYWKKMRGTHLKPQLMEQENQFQMPCKEDAEKIILGLGGSATNDGGTGFQQRWGLNLKMRMEIL